MILLIDNYDSFAHNLARYLRRLGQQVIVARNDTVDIPAIRELAPQAIILSPGPCTPNEAGCTLDVARQFYTEIPLLGICLGHQTIAAALGASIVRAETPMHGRTSVIQNDGSWLFDGLPPSFSVCRYHSLVVDPPSLPEELSVTASCEDRTIMAISHRDYPVHGLQFHPEAILTEYGFDLLRNFLTLAGLSCSDEFKSLADDEFCRPTLLQPQPSKNQLPDQPVTF